MLDAKTITDPSRIVRLLTGAYRRLKPHSMITQELDNAIDSVIDDIAAGREVSAVRSWKITANPMRGEVPCSTKFLSFLDTLSNAMNEQYIHRVSPTRVAELLVNAFDDEAHSHPFMRLCGGIGQPTLVSSARCDEFFGGRLHLKILDPRDAEDWNLQPTV